ncbi:MAG: hypothetical protein Q9174_004294 [Haloplaca sp. 1 TL-2023]
MPLKLKPPALPSQPTPEAPPSATTAKRKLTLTFGGASHPTPSPADPPASATTAKKPKAPKKPKVEKPVRSSKPTPKKREFDASSLADEEDEPKANGLATVKRLKLVAKPKSPAEDDFKKIKHVRLKFKGRVPDRPIGVGYDSGSSDVEQDPALEEEFILRMEPGEDCEYIRQAIAERRWGPSSEGGADVRMHFLRTDGRRAVVSVQKRLYAACLVDLPCIVEGMKSWDKKAWFKTADICQMLLVLGRVKQESEAMEYELPKDVDPQTFAYAHGLTPPMQFARQRRFRTRLDNRTIEAVEEEVERLLQEDQDCLDNGGEVIYEECDANGQTQADRDQAAREQAEDLEEYGDDDAEEGEEDAEGDEEEDIANNYEPIEEDEAEDEEDIAAALGELMEQDDDGDASPSQSQMAPMETPDSAAAAETPLQQSFMSSPSSPAATPAKVASVVDSGDDDSASGSGDEPEELDEAELEKQHERDRQLAEIIDMKAMIKSQERKALEQANPHFRNRLMKLANDLKRDLEVKMAALGVEEEADEG